MTPGAFAAAGSAEREFRPSGGSCTGRNPRVVMLDLARSEQQMLEGWARRGHLVVRARRDGS